jgi:hypothetical protein
MYNNGIEIKVEQDPLHNYTMLNCMVESSRRIAYAKLNMIVLDQMLSFKSHHEYQFNE